MIIESLRSTQSSIDMNNDYNDSMQGNHARAKCSDGPTSRETQEVIEKKAMEDAKPVLLSNSDAAEYESLAQDSDSDDSVDRDIEEAIQEYLKKKNDYRAQSIQNNAPCDKVIIRGRAPKKIESAILPVNTAKKKEEPRDPLRLNTSKRLRCVSSSSASSDDSFDQSIQEEIKRFLTKKKAHAGETHISKKPKSTPPPVKSEKSSAEVRLHFKKNAVNRTFVSSNTATTQTTRDPSDNFQIFCKVDENLSDSSSDDGIEEAIQRYQLEKQKEKEGDVFKFSGSTQTQPSLDLCAAQGAHIVKHQKILSRKKKQSGSKPAVSTHNISKDLDTEEVRGNVSPSPETVRFEPTFPLKGNTSAELMCAEAILDISKAVLPTTIQPSVIVTKACTNTSPLPSGDVPYCSENSDSSSVDSDDGIEQEIRNFLALKAQMNSQPASTGSLVQKEESTCALQQKFPPSRTKKLSLSLSRKRKLKDVESVAREGVPQENHIKEQQQVDPVVATDGSGSATLQTTSTSAEFNEASDMPSREGDVDHQYNSVKPMEVNSSGTAGQLGKESLQFEDTEREQTGDKSSSLDSDEDLDAAIKELLKTKRKVKKKTKDSKLKCKKHVRFGGVEMYPVDSLETVKHKSVADLPAGANQSIPKSYISKSSSRNLNPKFRRSNFKKEKKSKASDQPKHVPESKGQSTLDSPVTGKDHRVTGHIERIAEDTSSVDSDDSIELEIRKFLAEKAKASAVGSKHKEEQKETCSRISNEAREIKLEAQHAQQIGISASVGLHSGQSNQLQPGSESEQISATDSQEFIVRSTEKRPQVTVALGKNATVSHRVKNGDEALHRHSFEKKSSQKSMGDSLGSTSAEQRGLVLSSPTTAENNIADLKDVDLNSSSQACQETQASVTEETFQIRTVISSDVEGGQQQKMSSYSSLVSCNHQGKVRQSDKVRRHVPADDDFSAKSLKSGCEKGEEANREREFSSADVKSVYSKHSSVGHMMSLEKRQTRETDNVSLQSSVVESTVSTEMKQPVSAVQFTRPKQGRAKDSEDHFTDKGRCSSESNKKARECNTEEQEAGDVGLDETCLESDDDQSEIDARERLKGNGEQSTL